MHVERSQLFLISMYGDNALFWRRKSLKIKKKILWSAPKCVQNSSLLRCHNLSKHTPTLNAYFIYLMIIIMLNWYIYINKTHNMIYVISVNRTNLSVSDLYSQQRSNNVTFALVIKALSRTCMMQIFVIKMCIVQWVGYQLMKLYFVE